MEVSQAQELNRALDENRRLKQLVAVLTPYNQALKLVLEKRNAARGTTRARAAVARAAPPQPATGVSSAGLQSRLNALPVAQAQ